MKTIDEKLTALIKSLESLNVQDQALVIKENIKNISLNDFYIFAKFILEYSEVNLHTHGEAIECLEHEARRKIIVLPRGCFKSSLCAVSYPIWRLLKNPNLRILIDSELYTNSKNFLREIKNKMKSVKFVNLFGDLEGERWNESEIILKTRTSSNKEANITVGAIGTTKVGQHYDLIISDDLNSPKNSNTPEKCSAVIDHMRYNLSILEPEGEYVFVGTRYAESDVIGYLLKSVLKEPKLAEGKLELSGRMGLIESQAAEFEKNLKVL